MVHFKVSFALYSTKGFSVFLQYWLISWTRKGQQVKDKQISISSFYMTNSKLNKVSAWFNSYAATVIMFPARLCEMGFAARMWNWCSCCRNLIVFWSSVRAFSTCRSLEHTQIICFLWPFVLFSKQLKFSRDNQPDVWFPSGDSGNRRRRVEALDSPGTCSEDILGTFDLLCSCLNGRDCFPTVAYLSLHYLLLWISLNYLAFAALKFARMSNCTQISSLVSEWNFMLIQFIILLADTSIDTPSVFCCLNADIIWHKAEDECGSLESHIWAVLIILRPVDSPQLILSSVDSGEALLVDSLAYICRQSPQWWPAKRKGAARPSRVVCLSPNILISCRRENISDSVCTGRAGGG